VWIVAAAALTAPSATTIRSRILLKTEEPLSSPEAATCALALSITASIWWHVRQVWSKRVGMRESVCVWRGRGW
jgi:hypothetical protein